MAEESYTVAIQSWSPGGGEVRHVGDTAKMDEKRGDELVRLGILTPKSGRGPVVIPKAIPDFKDDIASEVQDRVPAPLTSARGRK
jgi:hypothetical protein